MGRFTSDTLARLEATEEIDIETRATARATPRRTTIWVVAAEDDVYVRSIRGKRGVWYRELTANPIGAIRLARRRVRVRAVAVRRKSTLELVSEAFRTKYRGSPYLWSVLERHTLGGTLRLEPAERLTRARVRGATSRA